MPSSSIGFASQLDWRSSERHPRSGEHWRGLSRAVSGTKTSLINSREFARNLGQQVVGRFQNLPEAVPDDSEEPDGDLAIFVNLFFAVVNWREQAWLLKNSTFRNRDKFGR